MKIFKNIDNFQRFIKNLIFTVCDELGHLKEIFKFPLLPEEEEEFIAYLDNCTSKDSGDLKILYLLSRGRYKNGDQLLCFVMTEN